MQKIRAHFIHIGKTGGTAVKEVLKQQLETQRYQICLHRHSTSLADISEGEKVFFFLRNPISRFISGFYSRQRKGRHGTNEWNPTEKKMFASFRTPNELACRLADPTSDKHPLAIEAMEHGLHMNRLVSWYGSLEYFYTRIDDILFVGFQEFLDEDFQQLKGVLGITIPDCPPKDAFRAHKTPAYLDTHLDPIAIQALETWYQEDIRFIEICKDLNSAKVAPDG